MVHLTFHGKPICEDHGRPCEYATRSLAFDDILLRRLNSEVKISVGKCPNMHKEAS